MALLRSRNANQNLGLTVPHLHGSHKQPKQELLPAEHGRGKDPGDNSNVRSLGDIQPRHQQEKTASHKLVVCAPGVITTKLLPILFGDEFQNSVH